MLVPSPQGWAGRPLVRDMRVHLHDGALVVRWPGGRLEQRAAAGEVTAVVLVDGAPGPRRGSLLVPAATYGQLVFLAGDRPVLAVWLAEWLPTPNRDLDDRTVRDVSGANALAAALGVAVEPGEVSLAARTGSVLVTPLPLFSRRQKLALTAAWAGTAVWFFWAASFRVTSVPRPPVIGLLGAAGALGLVLMWLMTRRQATAELPDPPGSPIAPAPDRPVPRAFRRTCRMFVAARWVVLVDSDGREAWMPGPALGGITTGVVTTQALVLDDAAGHGLAALPLDTWFGQAGSLEQARDVLARVGIAVREEPSNRAPGAWFAGPDPLGPLDHPRLAEFREPRGWSRSGYIGGIAGLLGAANALQLGELVTAAVSVASTCLATGPGLVDWLTARRARALT